MLRGGCHCHWVYDGIRDVSFFFLPISYNQSPWLTRSRNSVYTDLKDNHPMCESFASAMNVMGHEVLLDAAGHQGVLSGGSTDMGELISSYLGRILAGYERYTDRP